MKKLLLIASMLHIGAFGFGSESKSSKNLIGRFDEVKINMADSSGNHPQIPIIAILGIPENLTNLPRYQQMRASGITESYYYFPNADMMEAALNVAQKAGLKLFVACPELKTNPEATAKRFMNHSAVAGYFLTDEPGTGTFGDIRSWIKRIRAVDGNHVCYVNLLPNSANNKQMGANSYQDYLDAFVRNVPAQLLSFDHYPITGNTNQSVRSQWYENLEMISAEARKARIPFWGFALTVSHLIYPVPTMGALKLQVFANLAYGAQGIEYFSYWTPGGVNPKYSNGPIGPDGKKTGVYDKIQEINKEIKNLSEVFLGAEVVSVAHTGNVPQGTKPLGRLPNAIASLKTDGIGAIVSVLKNNGKSYLVVVNHDFTAPMNLTIKCNAGVSQVLKDGTSKPAQLSSDVVAIGPGDLAIYSWSDTQ